NLLIGRARAEAKPIGPPAASPLLGPPALRPRCRTASAWWSEDSNLMSVQPLEPGFRLGKYEVLSHLATGGMAVVYKAMDVDLRRLVALKILDPEQAHREDLRERFKREARHAARLSYKHIVTLYEAGEEQG